MIDPLLSRLEKVKSRGAGAWLACCPAHNDSDPSMTIKELRDGRILVHCFVGCGAADIMAAIGLSMADLFPGSGLGEYRSFERIKQEVAQKKRGPVKHEETILEIAEGQRKAGLRLSKEDVRREMLAWKRLHGHCI